MNTEQLEHVLFLGNAYFAIGKSMNSITYLLLAKKQFELYQFYTQNKAA